MLQTTFSEKRCSRRRRRISRGEEKKGNKDKHVTHFVYASAKRRDDYERQVHEKIFPRTGSSSHEVEQQQEKRER